MDRLKVAPTSAIVQTPSEGRVLRTPEAARFLSVSPATLVKWRCVSSNGPIWIRIGARMVGYLQSDLDTFVQSHGKRRSTSDSPRAV